MPMNESVSGEIKGIPLSSFLQMLAWEKASVSVQVESGSGAGEVFLCEGELIHASTGNIAGAKAVYALCAMTAPRILLQPFRDCPRTVHQSVAYLLLEASRQADEHMDYVVNPFDEKMHSSDPPRPLDPERIVEAIAGIAGVRQVRVVDNAGTTLALSGGRHGLEAASRYAELTGAEIGRLLGCGALEWVQVIGASGQALLLLPIAPWKVILRSTAAVSPLTVFRMLKELSPDVREAPDE